MSCSHPMPITGAPRERKVRAFCRQDAGWAWRFEPHRVEVNLALLSPKTSLLLRKDEAVVLAVSRIPPL